MKKFLYAFFIAPLFIYAQQNATLTDQYFSQGIIKAQQRQQQIFSDDTPEVIFEHIKSATEENTHVQKAKYVQLFFKPAMKKNNFIKNNSKKHWTKFYLAGYCRVPYEVSVSRLAQFVSLTCNFNKGEGVLTAMFVPDIYSKALIGKPLYVTLNNKKYYVKGGVIMNALKTSINIASVVNDRKIERFIAQTGVDSANIVTKQALAYLQQKQQSETQSQAIYPDSNTSNPVVVTNTQAPHVKDYIQNATVQILSKIINNVSNTFFMNLPYLFKVNAHTVFYVNLYVTDEYEGLPNLSIKSDSLDISNPKGRKNIILNGGIEKK